MPFVGSERIIWFIREQFGEAGAYLAVVPIRGHQRQRVAWRDIDGVDGPNARDRDQRDAVVRGLHKNTPKMTHEAWLKRTEGRCGRCGGCLDSCVHGGGGYPVYGVLDWDLRHMIYGII